MPEPPPVPVLRPAEPVLRLREGRQRPDLLVLAAQGDLDARGAAALRRALGQRRLPRYTVLDLSGVSSLAPAGVRVLNEAGARARLEHRQVGVVAGAPPVVRVLRAALLDDGLPVYRRLADAVRDLRAVTGRARLVTRIHPRSGEGAEKGMTTDHVHDVSAALLELTESLRAEQPRDETLARMAARAVTLVPGADAASVTLFDDGVPATVAATEPSVLPLDEAQYALGDGPCIQATRTEQVVRTEFGQARRCWPALAGAAAEAGVETMLSCPLFVRTDNAAEQEAAQYHHLSGALNVWSRHADAFEPVHAALIAVFTTAMSGVILTAARWRLAEAEARQLLAALESRDAIATAKGIVMARRGLTAREAFDWLTEVSQRSNRKVRDVAAVILADPGLVEPCDRGGRHRAGLDRGSPIP